MELVVDINKGDEETEGIEEDGADRVVAVVAVAEDPHDSRGWKPWKIRKRMLK